MKSLALAFILLPFAIHAQSHTEYDRTLKQFIKFYNAGQSDSLYKKVFTKTDWAKKPFSEWYSKSSIQQLHGEVGLINAYRYINRDKKSREPRLVTQLYKITYNKESNKSNIHAMRVSFERKSKKITGINFITSSREIDSLLKRN